MKTKIRRASRNYLITGYFKFRIQQLMKERENIKFIEVK